MYRVDARAADTGSPAIPAGPLAIELEIPCSRCGYVLRGLKTGARCPECGAPTTASVFGDKLEYCERGYVRSLWLGAVIASWAVGVMLVCAVVTAVPVLISMLTLGGNPPRWVQAMFAFTFFFLPGLCWGGGIAGWWLVTAGDPARVGTAADPRARRVLRAVLMVETACWGVLVGTALGGVLSAIPPGVYVPVAQVSSLLVPWVLLAHVLGASRYVKQMGPRLGSLFTDQVCLGHTAAAWVCTGLVLAFVAAIWMGGEIGALFVLIAAFLAACVLAGIHLGVLGIVRAGARDGLAAQRRRAKKPDSLSRGC